MKTVWVLQHVTPETDNHDRIYRIIGLYEKFEDCFSDLQMWIKQYDVKQDSSDLLTTYPIDQHGRYYRMTLMQLK